MARAVSWLACIGLVSIGVRVVVPVISAQGETDGDARRRLEIFLRTYAENDRTATYDVAFVDLNGDGSREAVVYLEGRYLCGSGGCHTLVFRYDRSSYRLISDIPITWPPIRLLDGTTNGWRDVSVWVRGGGLRGHEVVLPFDGNTYPTNPSMPPARETSGNMSGEGLISVNARRTPGYR